MVVPMSTKKLPNADLTQAARDLMARLTELGDPARAAQERAYLHSEMDFLGVSVPDSRRAIKEMLRTLPGLDRSQALVLADLLWREPVFEGRRSATEVLVLRSSLLTPADFPAIE